MGAISRIGFFKVFIGLSCASLSATASEDIAAKLQRMVEGISEECYDHVRVRTDAEWAAIVRAGKSGEFSDHFKESLFRVTHAQCVLAQQILVLEAVREEVAEDDWIDLGGRESMLSLQEKLISTFPH